ncbi:hypothetical protein PIB30_074828, partial [Stylosanthes scabra]|nr:hypothetical protein [Stylosanthes scabra]
TAVLARPPSSQLHLPALSLLLTLRSTLTSAHRSRHKAQFPSSSTPHNVSSLLHCSTAVTVLSQRLGLGKGGLRMAPEEALVEKLQWCGHHPLPVGVSYCPCCLFISLVVTANPLPAGRTLPPPPPGDCYCNVPALLVVAADQRLKVVHDTMIPIGRMWMYDRDNHHRGDMTLHLYRFGFMPSYWIWTEHSEIDEVGVNRNRNVPIANMDE